MHLEDLTEHFFSNAGEMFIDSCLQKNETNPLNPSLLFDMFFFQCGDKRLDSSK